MVASPCGSNVDLIEPTFGSNRRAVIGEFQDRNSRDPARNRVAIIFGDGLWGTTTLAGQ
jgi:hypothetical protein